MVEFGAARFFPNGNWNQFLTLGSAGSAGFSFNVFAILNYNVKEKSMRKIALILIGALFLFSCTTTSTKESKEVRKVKAEKQEYSIQGIWAYENSDFAGAELTFAEDNVVSLSLEGEVVTGSYLIDYSVYPVNLDVEWPDLGIIQTIIRFLDDNKFQLEDNEIGAERPVEFSSNSQLLLRLK